MAKYVDTTTIDSRWRTRTVVEIDQPKRKSDYDSVYIHYRFKPTGDEGQMVTVQGRKAAQEYIEAMVANDPRYEFWLVDV